MRLKLPAHFIDSLIGGCMDLGASSVLIQGSGAPPEAYLKANIDGITVSKTIRFEGKVGTALYPPFMVRATIAASLNKAYGEHQNAAADRL